MEVIRNRRRIIKGRITRIENVAEEHKARPLDKAGLQLYLTKLDTLSKELDSWQDAAVAACQEAEYEDQEQEYVDMMDRIDTLSILFMSATNNQSSIVSPNTSMRNVTADVRLPRLELPSFSGQYENWLPFHDLFTATIHNNETLSGAQKLQYLKSSLRNEAALLIQYIPVTDNNYQEAWDILMRRYNNNREIINVHVKRLFDQPCISLESATALRKLVDTTTECLQALKVLNEPVQYWDSLLIHLIKSKLDSETRRQWELTLKRDDKPTFDQLNIFLDQRARALASTQTGTTTSNIKGSIFQASRSREQFQKKQVMTAHHGATQITCTICKENHSIFRCPTLLKASHQERRNLVKVHNLCFNCFRTDHRVNECKASHCKKCSHKHHTFLHPDGNQETTNLKVNFKDQEVTSHIAQGSRSPSQVLLATALVKVKDSGDRLQSFRVLLDSASQASFITERCAQRLMLKRNHCKFSIAGIGSSGVGCTKGSMVITLHSNLDPSVELVVEAFILPRVTGTLPNFRCEPNKWSHINGLQLADPSFHTPGDVDILLGADVYGDILEVGSCKGALGTPVAYNTIFGWVVSGPVDASNKRASITVHLCSVDEQIRHFWELEELPETKRLTVDEIRCENHFNETFSRDNTGRYMVRLPFKSPTHQLGESRQTAVRRFLQVERRLQADSSLRKQYNEFMEEYISLGHMKRIDFTDTQQNASGICYLPHHAVVKSSSTTTKLRVVFDASAKSSTGYSLNDELLVGPRLQDDLLAILIRFRIPAIAINADITKMYRQIKLHPDDLDFQRILWRSNPNEPLQEFNLQTVTYGTASAPYLATKVLQQLSLDEGRNFPLAAPVLTEDFYMDDLMSGKDTTEEALALQSELIEITKRGGFELRKWASNDPALLEAIPAELRELQPHLPIEEDESVKTLGLRWHPATDQFTFIVKESVDCFKITKRTMLSTMAKLFDPLGLLAPITIRAKMMLQELWQIKVDWDDQLPQHLAAKWMHFLEELPTIENIRVHRLVSKPNATSVSLHGFSDASEKAFAATVYMRVTTEAGTSIVNLIASKTRVAPLKQITIPRLELCGAVLLARLIETIQSSLKEPIKDVYCWCDSTIVLAWLSSPPQRWKTFVANRVAEIQGLIPSALWNHVQSEDNPADCASRGLSANDLRQNQLWWNGPLWLQRYNTSDTLPILQVSEDCDCEERKVIPVIAHTVVDNSLLMSFSSLSKLIRITACVRRFICNCRRNPLSRQTGPLTSEELNNALFHWVRVVQRADFSKEIHCLMDKKPIPSNSKIIQLYPFMDKDGLLRVGGRLTHAKLTPDRINPILLSKNNKLTELLVQYEHVRLLHGGPQLVMSVLQRRFWILGMRDVVRLHVRRCVQCVRERGTTMQPLMGDLPKARINPGRPFLKCGVDYAGPYQLRLNKGRGQKTWKTYIAIFVCFTTRAIHLELVSDASAEAFLAALRRFVSRRGKCSDIYSDCGSNFVGAARELKDFMKLVTNTKGNISSWCANEGISWHFNPPAAPHFGGLWEAGVKSVKFHLKRVVGISVLTVEELETLLCQVEACLNSRPLTAMSSDPNDFTALTPGHFLIGDSLTSIPEPDVTHIKLNRLSRWQLTQKLLQHFWRRWRNEYLSRLQQRPKWFSQSKNLKPGDLVLIKEEDLPPTRWKMGRIEQLHPGPDEIVRVVTLKTANGQLKRPLVKLCPLPLD